MVKSISLQLRATPVSLKAHTWAPKKFTATTSAAMPSHTKAPIPPPLKSLWVPIKNNCQVYCKVFSLSKSQVSVKTMLWKFMVSEEIIDSKCRNLFLILWQLILRIAKVF